ncbi:MAG: hypothetical protein K6F30_06950 [Lachnospiraceae bacterium]|nr:hypothetical protein [Lachnospiraceae bacterium]
MFFKKKQNKKEQLDLSFEKVVSEIQKIEDWDNPKKIEHYILDSCEHIIATTKEIESLKAEYRVLTSYLEDIDKLRKLPKKEFGEISLVAKNIEDLEKSQKLFKSTEPKLNEETFVLMSENEDQIPDTILRMQSNEKYQATVEKNMKMLEAEKSEYEIERNEILHSNKLIRRLSVLILIAFASFLVLAFALKSSVEMDIGMFLVTILFIGALGVFIIFLIHSKNISRNRVLVREINKNISLLNVVRMKYANVTKALEFEKERYNVTNSYELNYIWEAYLDMVRAQEQFIQDNDDFEYFSKRLMRMLKKLELYDEKIWLNQISALVHSDVMNEVNHDLVKRRQKIRDQIAENTKSVKSERDEIDRLMKIHNYYVPEILEIITSVDRLCGLKKPTVV